MTVMPDRSTSGDASDPGRRDVLLGGVALGVSVMAGAALMPEGPSPARATLANRSPGPALPGTDNDNPADIAAAKGLCFGSAVSMKPLRSDPEYGIVNRQLCNTVVHGSALQWHELEKRRGGPYDFGDADAIYQWSHAAGKAFRGHALLDWAGLPAWLEPDVATLTASAAADKMRDHITQICRHFRGKMIQWNVANEPINGKLRQYAWSKKLGENYLDIAFQAAGEADPGIPLAINQNLIEGKSAYQEKSLDALLELVQRLKTRKVPIASVGIEGHLQSSAPLNLDGLDHLFRELEKMDISFMITEFDIDDRQFIGEKDIRDENCAAMARDFFDVTLSQPRCEGLIIWGLTSRYNWLSNFPDRARADGLKQRPTLLDDDYKPIPMWQATIDALRKAPGPGKYSILPR
jgi:endo-1,4-beta-xylanase